MSKSAQRQEDWVPCPAGKLANLAGQQRTRQRRRFLVQTGSACGVVVAALGVGWFAYRRWSESTDLNHAGIACYRVRELWPQFQLGQLGDALTTQIQNHLVRCEMCRTEFGTQSDRVSTQAVHAQQESVCGCSCSRRHGLVESLATNRNSIPLPPV